MAYTPVHPLKQSQIGQFSGLAGLSLPRHLEPWVVFCNTLGWFVGNLCRTCYEQVLHNTCYAEQVIGVELIKHVTSWLPSPPYPRSITCILPASIAPNGAIMVAHTYCDQVKVWVMQPWWRTCWIKYFILKLCSYIFTCHCMRQSQRLAVNRLAAPVSRASRRPVWAGGLS